MTIWARNSSEFIGLLTGFEGRDAFAKSQRFPAVTPLEMDDAAETGRLPLEAQDEILELVYEILGILREALKEGNSKKLPPANALLDKPKVDRLFRAATRSMVDAVASAEPLKRFNLLQCAVKGVVTEAYTERLRNEFVRELTHFLKALEARLAEKRNKYDDWLDKLDGGIVLYDVFRPNLWKLYGELWSQWRNEMERIHALIIQLQRIDETLQAPTEEETGT